MNLREPKKKKRVHVLQRPMLPIHRDANGGWAVYTAHLSASGTCIVDPVEMEALYSMGFFGKGSLSRSFPSFGRRRFGVPPIARNRQWARRVKWLQELQSLNENNCLDPSNELKNLIGNNSDTLPQSESAPCSSQNNTDEKTISQTSPVSGSSDTQKINNSKSTPKETSDKKLMDNNIESLEQIIHIEEVDNNAEEVSRKKSTSTASCDMSEKSDENDKAALTICSGSMRVDEIVLDSTEDEEPCEIVEKDLSFEKDQHSVNDKEMTNKLIDYYKCEHESEMLTEEETDPCEILVLPDTDSETENYLTNVKSRIEKDGFPINETLHLTFEESFFLMYGLGCLQLIHYDGSIFSIKNAWTHFQLQDKYFIQKYVVYHYFRSKGWVVKPGLKFGGDFLLYKQGPPFYHASYIVIIEVLDADTLLRDDGKSMRKVTWKNLIGMERLSETISKEILLAQILWPSSVPYNNNQMPIDALSEFTVRELLWRRWDPKRKPDLDWMDDEESDSM